MVCKIFLDINIVADFLDEERPEHASALILFDKIEKRQVQAYFSESVVNTACYVMRKIASATVLKDFIKGLLSFIGYLQSSPDTILSAYHIAKNDLEDAVLYQIALENKLDYFVTSDIKDYKKIEHPLLPVVSSKKMLSIIS